MSSHDGNRDSVSTVPRAVVHKKVLDAARTRPEASMAELADDVTGVSVDLVERVLDEYGDPAAEQPATTDTEGSEDRELTETMSKEQTTDPTSGMEADAHDEEPDVGELTDKQREILRIIHRQPEATQQDLAARLDVSQATVSNHLNSINGFSWQDRQRFVEVMFNDDQPPDDAAPEDAVPTETTPATAASTAEPNQDLADAVLELSERIEAVEDKLDGPEPDTRVLFGDPDLACKVIHASFSSEQITADEERQIVREVITAGGPDD